MFSKLTDKAVLAATGMMMAAVAATPAMAQDWWKAETDKFIVYSSGDSDDARELAENLERLDDALRFMRNLGQDAPLAAERKLVIFQTGDVEDIGKLAGQRGVAGFFSPREGQSVAFTPTEYGRDLRGRGARVERKRATVEEVMFHEYTHYFMFHHGAAAYPAWYREGFAELFGTIDLKEDGFVVGRPPARGGLLQTSYDISRMFDPPEKMRYADYIQSYGYGWLLTTYLSFTPERQGQLADYLRRLNAGEESLEAAKAAFGDLDQLKREIDRFSGSRAPLTEITFENYQPATATVTPLGPDEEAVMELFIESQAGWDERRADFAAGQMREILGQYPGSVPVMNALMEAEFDGDNLDRAEAVAKQILAQDPDHLRANVFLARIAAKRAEEDVSHWAEARRYFGRASQIDPRNAEVMLGYYLSYYFSDEPMTETALIALEQAYEFAPFSPMVRRTLAHVLLTENRPDAARTVLLPLASDPHGGKRTEKYHELLAQIDEGEFEPVIEELRPLTRAEAEAKAERERRGG